MAKKKLDHLDMFNFGLTDVDRVECPKDGKDVQVRGCKYCYHLRRINYADTEVVCGYRKDVEKED